MSVFIMNRGSTYLLILIIYLFELNQKLDGRTVAFRLCGAGIWILSAHISEKKV